MPTHVYSMHATRITYCGAKDSKANATQWREPLELGPLESTRVYILWPRTPNANATIIESIY